MATLKQKKTFDNIVENRGNVSKAMEDAGYSPKTAKNPKNFTESKGFKEIMEEYGLTDELIIGSLVDDIKSKKRNRVAELTLAAKIKGLSVERHDITSNGETIGATIVFEDKPEA